MRGDFKMLVSLIIMLVVFLPAIIVAWVIDKFRGKS